MTGGRPAAIHSTFNSVIRRIAPTADTGSVRDGWTNSCCSLTITRNSFSSPVTLLRPSVSSTLIRNFAIAERPCDALCLSVVSFNSTKRRALSFLVSYMGYRFINAYN